MSKSKFILGKDGNVIGRKTLDERTQVTTVRDQHCNVLGYGDAKRNQTRGPDENLLRRDRDSNFLLK